MLVFRWRIGSRDTYPSHPYHLEVRSVGPQPPTISRPCYICKNGLGERKYCYNCGNTSDRGKVRAADPSERTSKEITQALTGSVRLQAGLKYIVSIQTSNNTIKVVQGLCEWTSGPFARIAGYDINIIEIKEVQLCDS